MDNRSCAYFWFCEIFSSPTQDSHVVRYYHDRGVLAPYYAFLTLSTTP